ncbi:MAG: hypothetical protein JSW25_01960, partial [Thermoplasmata archaeon]
MALREDLERLADECEACALTDSKSIDNHMITCPSCVDHRMKADEIDGQVERMRVLADKDEMERRHQMGYDVNDFLNMSEAQRAEAMRDMFDNIDDLDTDRRTVVIKTRTDLMTSLPKRERDALMRTARNVYSSYDQERLDAERMAIEEATAS